MNLPQTLQNKRALVVGGGTGIGQAIAYRLALAGAHVAIAGRREDKLATASYQFTTLPDAPLGAEPLPFHVVDVANRNRVLELVNWFQQQLGPIDILVNAAGVNIKNRTMAAMRPEDWDQLLGTNATGAYNCLFAVLPQMRQRQDGIVVQISSIAGKRAIDLGGIAYCASKFAMTALGTAVGQEEAKHGIRITNVYPGEVDTPLLEQRPTPVSDEHRARMLHPEDVAELVHTIVSLPPRAHVPEVVIKPRLQAYF